MNSDLLQCIRQSLGVHQLNVRDAPHRLTGRIQKSPDQIHTKRELAESTASEALTRAPRPCAPLTHISDEWWTMLLRVSGSILLAARGIRDSASGPLDVDSRLMWTASAILFELSFAAVIKAIVHVCIAHVCDFQRLGSTVQSISRVCSKRSRRHTAASLNDDGWSDWGRAFDWLSRRSLTTCDLLYSLDFTFGYYVRILVRLSLEFARGELSIPYNAV